MIRLSIVIPVLGNTAAFERTLVSVLENRPPDCEILAVLNTSYADPYQLGDDVRFINARSRAGFVECVNVGIQTSQAPIVHVLLAGLEASEGWTDPAIAQFADPRVAAVAPLIARADDAQTPLAAGLRYRRSGDKLLNVPARAPTAGHTERVGVLAPCAMASFYRKAALNSAQGLPANVGNELADVQLGLALKKAGWHSVFEAQSLILADEIPQLERSGLRRGYFSERLFWLHAKEFGLTTSLLAHPLSIIAQVLGSLPSPSALTGLLGRFLAACVSTVYLPNGPEATSASEATLPEGFRIDGAHRTAPAETQAREESRVRRAL